MFEIGIPNFIKTDDYKNDPLKYNYFRTYNRGKYTLLVSHDGEFFSLMDIATTLKKFKIFSLFMIISKDKKNDEYTFLIGNSFYPYEKTLLNKSTIKKGKEYQIQLTKAKKFIDMEKKLLNSDEMIIFPIDVSKKEVEELIGDSINYKIMDITKYLLLTPVTKPLEKTLISIVSAILIIGGFYYLNNYLDEYFKYEYKPKIQKEISKEKSFLKSEKKRYEKILKKNEQLKNFLKDKNKMKIYRG